MAVRFYAQVNHGTVPLGGHVYTDSELLTVCDRLPSNGASCVLFNNIPRVQDAQRFVRLLGLSNDKP